MCYPVEGRFIRYLNNAFEVESFPEVRIEEFNYTVFVATEEWPAFIVGV